MEYLEDHLKDYSECINAISKRMRKNLKNHPLKFARLLTEALLTAKNREEFQEIIDNKSTLAMRKAHDFFGWMAKNGSIGACKGAIYRSINYMQVPLKNRSGRRNDAATDFGVHIEHSIPINQIIWALWSRRNLFLDLENRSLLTRTVHEEFIKLSVCTAITRQEQKNCLKPTYEKRHPDFDSTGRPQIGFSLKDVRPFIRYDFTGGLKIFEMINGQEIKPDIWSLKDHEDLISNIDVYHWQRISKYDFV